MKLLRPLPPNRTYDQLLNHFLTEKALAERLKRSSREERVEILATMYIELFSQVPDHPRLTQRESEQRTAHAIQNKLPLVKRYLNPSVRYVEFGPGDCRFAFMVAQFVQNASVVDIFDQRNPADSIPDNFNQIIYDGYDLDHVAENSVDLVFSDQLIEHIHPDDTKNHFQLAHRILKSGGRYIFRTPHRYTGPHDVSKFFSYDPQGFHLKEWTYREIHRLLNEVGYSSFQPFWYAKGVNIRLPYRYFSFFEQVLSRLPKQHMRFFSRYLIPVLSGIAVK